MVQLADAKTLEERFVQQEEQKLREAQKKVKDERMLHLNAAKSAATPSPVVTEDVAPAKPAAPAPVPQPEVQTSENAFSTFSLNVSDVSFKLAAASLEKGEMPEPAHGAQRGVHQRLRLPRSRAAAGRADRLCLGAGAVSVRAQPRPAALLGQDRGARAGRRAGR